MSEVIRDTTTETFEADVLRAATPVLVDFHADWCGPCQALAPVVSELADEHRDELEVRKVDVDANPELAQRYGVRGIPTLILFKDGTAASSVVGVTSKGALSALIEARLNDQ